MKYIRRASKLIEQYSTYIALALMFIYGLAGAVISVVRFWQFDVFYFDFGLFDKAIWSVSKFAPPIIDHIAYGEKIIFVDHFSPSLFLLSPLFWIFPQSETLLVAQALAVAASGFVLFLIAKHLLKNALYALVLLITYYLFVGLQNAVIIDFHEVTVATLVFMTTFYCVVKKKIKLFFLSLIILLGFKESLFLVGIGIGFAIFCLHTSWRKIALLTIFLSVLWGIISIKFIIPYFSGGMYFYSNELAFNGARLFTSFFDVPIKQHTIFYTFLSFGFLPLLTPPFWPLIIQDFLIRFYPENFPTRWGLGLHYSALLASIMAVSSIYSLRMLQKRLKPKYVYILLLLLLLNALFLYRVVLDGPFGLFYNPAFYTHTKNFELYEEIMAKIPKNASVMAQNNIAPHFTHQKAWHLISDNQLYKPDYYHSKMPDYILIDNRPGQNPNNHFGIKDVNVLITNVKNDKNYQVIYNKNDFWVFKKITKIDK